MIACLGDLFVDVTIRRARSDHSLTAEEHVDIVPGGSAANVAAWLAHTGASAGFIGSAGNDFAGDMLLAELARRGVQCAVSRSADLETGVCLYEVSASGSLRATAQRGANDLFELDDAQRQLLATTSWLHLTAYAFFSEVSRARVVEAVRLAREHGATISIDLGAPHLVRHIGAAEYKRLLAATQAGVVFANEEEASLMADSTGDPLRALSGLAPIAVLKRGVSGCRVRDGVLQFDVASVPTEEVDATGAGDAFAAGVIAALDSGVGTRLAMQAGARLGAQCVSLVGGRPPLARRG
jgi:ribokinase